VLVEFEVLVRLGLWVEQGQWELWQELEAWVLLHELGEKIPL
jgi:hypothetical protein